MHRPTSIEHKGAKVLLKGKVALVTGAGSGIGRAVSQVLAREGARVLVTDRQRQAGEETVELLARDGQEAAFFELDAADADAHVAAVAQAEQCFGRLDLACNNAGISIGPSGARTALADLPLGDWRAVLGINLDGVFYGMRAQIPAMLRARGGAVVNIASVMGQVAAPGLGAYVASKHGVVGLTRAAAIDYAEHGVRVNAVGPGYIDTPMLASKDDVTRSRLRAMHPMGRLGLASEIAELVLWLCSDRASFVTGAYYPADGGYLAR